MEFLKPSNNISVKTSMAKIQSCSVKWANFGKWMLNVLGCW